MRTQGVSLLCLYKILRNTKIPISKEGTISFYFVHQINYFCLSTISFNIFGDGQVRKCLYIILVFGNSYLSIFLYKIHLIHYLIVAYSRASNN